MNKEQYIDEIRADGIDFIDENYDQYDSYDLLWEEMQNVITGNYNGSYYFSRAKAAESVSDVIWDEDIVDMCNGLGYHGVPTEMGAEACDVIVRYCLIDELYGEFEDYYNDLREEEEEEDEE